MENNKTLDLLRELLDLSAIPELMDIYEKIENKINDFEKPLRIVITGMTKTGKSTLVNAFLQHYRAKTAVGVWTGCINWFKHVSYSPDGKEKCFVYYMDGRTEEHPIDSLADFTDLDESKTDWREIFISHPILLSFDLIDTPGMQSLIGDDSKKTAELLQQEDSKPDAYIYLMATEVEKVDMENIMMNVRGHNTIAALTRCDWMSKGGSYEEKAKDVIAGNMENYPQIRYTFSRFFAIAALYAQIAYTITSEEIEQLRKMSAEDGIEFMLWDIDEFKGDESLDKIISRSQREVLIDKMEKDGILWSVRYFKEHEEASSETFKQALLDYSNVVEMKDFVIRHFGGKRDFIKTDTIIKELIPLCTKCMRKALPEARNRLHQMLIRLNDFKIGFEKKYRLTIHLRDNYYCTTGGKPELLSENEWQRALSLLGEKGDSVFERLGLEENVNASVALHVCMEQINYWKKVANKYSYLNPEAHKLAKDLLSVCEDLCLTIRKM